MAFTQGHALIIGVGVYQHEPSLERSRALGYPSVVVLGHPAYYPRFGFGMAGDKGILLPFAAPPEACMVLELFDSALNGLQGTVEYPPEYSEE